MKKSVILGLLGLAAAVAPSFGQGFIKLDNYNTYGPLVTYGAGVPANGISGTLGTVGVGLNSSWTAGVYIAQGDITGSVLADPTGHGLVTDQNAGFVLATGAESGTTTFASAAAALTAGEFLAINGVQASAAVGSTVTVEVVAYSTASGSYVNSTIGRGHSNAFTMVTKAGNDTTPAVVGAGMTTFAVTPVPEPTAFALSGLGAADLLFFRRKK